MGKALIDDAGFQFLIGTVQQKTFINEVKEELLKERFNSS